VLPPPWAHLHDLLLSRNINPKTVSKMPGHAPIATILDTYSHMLPNMQDDVACEV
jgi:hypothetical protein